MKYLLKPRVPQARIKAALRHRPAPIKKSVAFEAAEAAWVGNAEAARRRALRAQGVEV